MNLSQLAKSDARREEAQLRVRHHAALIAGIVCHIWQGRTAPGRTRYFCRLRFSLFLLSASGGWVKVRLELQHLLPHMYQIHVFRFNPRSRCNSSSRCWYRAREHVLFFFFAVPEIFLFLSDNSSSILVAYLVHRAVYVLHYTLYRCMMKCD